MEKARVNPMLIYGLTILAIGVLVILLFKGCNRPSTSPAVDRLHSLNDSLYHVIQSNNTKTDSLFAKIDSIKAWSDTIIQRQEITNKYYTNETYTILNSSPSAASKQLRATLKKSDSLLKSGFYTRTYDLRRAAFQSELQ
jgi:predicted PurR-regulated permease PerM